MLTFVLFVVFMTVVLAAYTILPAFFNRVGHFSEQREQKLSNKMDILMSRSEAKKKSRLFIFAPIGLAVLFYFLFPLEFKFFGIVVGVVFGFIFPGMYIKVLTKKTRDKFNDQLVDALMIMSSSFRGGLSLIQAIEAVVEEMPDPINREFGIVLGENKMGVPLEDALNHLMRRMPSIALQQMTTAILLARETGGNLPQIFTRIANNIRERKKIQQNLDTLTVQGKIQGVVMTLLPIAFGFVIYTANRKIFNHMFTSEIGRALLMYALFSEIVGAYLIWKISTFKDF
ncbi:MAG: type II secretion system F family protein [Candidatus Omnitrophica bacterium]|nr:type II secretion system F family protein [Candidatus Omnitrophota bacterium]